MDLLMISLDSATLLFILSLTKSRMNVTGVAAGVGLL